MKSLNQNSELEAMRLSLSRAPMPRMYTRTGDKGETALFSGERVPKNSLRIDAYGTVDELSSWIGYTRSLIEDDEVNSILDRIQRDHFS